jgi:hypothetical protein
MELAIKEERAMLTNLLQFYAQQVEKIRARIKEIDEK